MDFDSRGYLNKLVAFMSSNAVYVMQALQKWNRSQSEELQLFEGRKPFKLQIMYVLWIHP